MEESGAQLDRCTVPMKSLGTSRIAVKSLGIDWGPAGSCEVSRKSLVDQQDSCEVSKKSLGTNRIAVQFGTSRIDVKSLG